MSPITREWFIMEDHVKRALMLPSMWVFGEDGEVEQVPIPESVKASGVLPEGYSVDFVVDPAVIVASLEDSGLADDEKCPKEQLEEWKDIINHEDNLSIVPTEIYNDKREITEQKILEGRREQGLKE